MPSGFQTAKDFSRASFKLGSTLTRGGVVGVPGPRPFRFGGMSKSGALVKLAHALMAAKINNEIDAANQTKLAEATARDEELKRYQLERAKDLATPDTPEEIQADARARTLGGLEARQSFERRGPVPDDIRKKYPGLPAELPLSEIADLQDVYGGPKPSSRKVWTIDGQEVPESVYAADYKRKHGFPTGDGATDSITESERAREAQANDAVKEALAGVKSRWVGGQIREIADESGKMVPAPSFTAMDLAANVTPSWFERDPTVVAARRGLQATRASNFLNSIGRAQDFEGLVQGLTRLIPGDPLLRALPPLKAGETATSERYALERVGRVRKDAILRAAGLARTRADIERLYQLTEDETDPLNQDAEVKTALFQRAMALAR